MVKRVISAENEIIKLTASLRERKNRDKRGLFVVEGRNFVSEIGENWNVKFFAATEHYYEKYLSSEKDKYNSATIYVMPEKLFAKISGTETPQGLLAVCEKNAERFALKKTDEKPLFLLVLCAVGDPGNVGTLMRTAHAFGVNCVILSKNCADVYSPKVIRASAGSVLNVPFMTDVDLARFADDCARLGVKTFAAAAKGSNSAADADLTGDCAIIVGNEAHGVLPEIVKICDVTVRIPMIGGAESLNASVSGAILMYEAARQRQK